MPKFGELVSNVIIVKGAEESELAHQFAKGFARVKNPNPQQIQGYVAEEGMMRAHNARHPRNKATLEKAPNIKAVDAVTKDGTKIQMKASSQKIKQIEGRNAIEEAGGGEVWITKGDQKISSTETVTVKESPVSRERIEKSAGAKAWAKTPAGVIGKAGVVGAATAGAITLVDQVIKIWKGETTWKEARKVILQESIYGFGSGAAVGGFGLWAGAAVLSSPVLLGGGVVVGAFAYNLCQQAHLFFTGKVSLKQAAANVLKGTAVSVVTFVMLPVILAKAVIKAAKKVARAIKRMARKVRGWGRRLWRWFRR